MILQLELNDPSQIEVIRAFLKALKIKHSIKEDDSKMSKKAYFEMLDERIKNSKKETSSIVSKEEQKAILFGS